MDRADKPQGSLMSRRTALLAGGGLIAAGGLSGLKWWQGYPDLLVADAEARTEAQLFDRGLIGVEHSGWTRPEGLAPAWLELAESLDTAMLIVGAGLAGTSLALHLAEAGIATVLIEARQPGWGASGRNAGHILPTLRDGSVFESFPDKGKAFLDAFREHHTIPYDLQAKHGFEGGAVRSGYLNLGEDKEAIADFRAQTAWMEAQGLLKLEEIGGEALRRQTGSKLWTHALDFVDGGHVNPYQFCNGVAGTAARLGARIFGGTPAVAIEPSGRRWRVRTPKGTVVADRVVFCTNAYPARVVPEFARAFYPLTAYALTTRPLDVEQQALINPGGKTMSQVPLDLNPLVRDRYDRLVLSSIPKVWGAQNAQWHFRNQLDWLHHAWPETKGMQIELESYWTGRVAMRDRQFPGVFQPRPGLYGLMYFNAWGNVMAPLMGKLLAQGLAADRPGTLPFPIERPLAVSNQGKMDRIIRHTLIPAARTGQKIGLI